MQFLAGPLLFASLISALAFDAPQATAVRNVINPRPEIGNPQPTEGPNVELIRRATSIPLTQVVGPDSLCGYEFGSSSLGLGICGTNTCGFATALGATGEIYCYGPTTSYERPDYWNTCFDGLSATSCFGNPACRDNTEVILCTTSTYTRCNLGTWVGLGIEQLWCDYTSYSTGAISIYTTYLGQVGRAFTTLGVLSSSTPSTTSSTTSSSLSSASSSTSPAHSVAPTPVPNPTPVGAIVGGVIGGLGLIAAIAAGVFFCLFLKRKDKNAANNTFTIPVEAYPKSNNPQPQMPVDDKYPAGTGVTVMPMGYAATSQKHEQQMQYQQPPPQQPQYGQPSATAEPIYAPYHQHQISPQSTGTYGQPQVSPKSAGNFPLQEQPMQQPTQQQTPQPIHATPHDQRSDLHRDSIGSTESAPRSPSPPSYETKMPTLPEMGVPSHHAYPVSDQYHSNELQS